MLKKSIKLIGIILVAFILSGCTQKYVCPDDYKLNGDTCYKTLTERAIPHEVAYCLSGYLINGRCYVVNSSYPKMAQRIGNSYYYSYVCDYGYNLVGMSCYPQSNPVSYRTEYSCPYGYSYPGMGMPHLNPPGAIPTCSKDISMPAEKATIMDYIKDIFS